MEMDTHTLPNAHTYLTCEGNQRSRNEPASGYFLSAMVYALVFASVYATVYASVYAMVYASVFKFFKKINFPTPAYLPTHLPMPAMSVGKYNVGMPPSSCSARGSNLRQL